MGKYFLVALVQLCFELLCSQGNSATFCAELTTLPKMTLALALAEVVFETAQHGGFMMMLSILGSSVLQYPGTPFLDTSL